MTVVVAASINETESANWFVTYTRFPSGVIATPLDPGNAPMLTLAMIWLA